MIVKWKERYSVNNESIDLDHKKLFELSNRVSHLITDVSNGEESYDEIMEVLNNLKAYTQYHFTREEKMFEKTDYEYITLHKDKHQEFINHINEIEEKVYSQQPLDTLNHLMIDLVYWIENHILEMDKSYMKYI